MTTPLMVPGTATVMSVSPGSHPFAGSENVLKYAPAYSQASIRPEPNV